ncbi:MAG: glycosyltransferase family 4 protein [Deltaproteobacteria bacterium]|jgi:UDP-glucose:(heptosyl)LPS alpha-1,3-glucosyltransferase|nr:glycosyltransferase family 4 protein [Deltaproteobacteria bacterium]MBW2497944.1 glycosyltransferase family 4 protein [Deltaproteobacteria bacterium]
MTAAGRADNLAAQPRGLELRIAIVIERFVPGTGGVENVAWQVAHGLVRAGDQVTVVCRESEAGDPPRPAGAAPRSAIEAVDRGSAGACGAADSEPPGRLRVQRVNAPSTWQPLRVLAFAAAARRTTRVPDDFDLVHGFSRTPHQDLYRAGGGSHADYLDRSHRGLGRLIRRLSPRHRVLLEIERRVFADPYQRIQCASRLVADDLVRRHRVDPARLFLLPNGVDLERFGGAAACSAGQALRAREGGGKDEPDTSGPIWLLPGSGWRRKGLDRSLQALARVADPGTRLWVAGRDDPGPWRRQAARLGLSDRVRFLGPRDDLEVLYHAVDGMLLPTRYDAFANVTFEAAAAGLPIVTSRANGAAEWLGQDVVLVDDTGEGEEAGGLTRALDGLAERDARHALGARAAACVAAYDWSTHVAALREEYRRIIARRRSRERG